jgi:hypothetical protein
VLGWKKSITGLENQDSDAIQAFKALFPEEFPSVSLA